MPEKPPEKFSSIERVIGKDISDEERQRVFEVTEKIFKDQEVLKKYLLEDSESVESIPDDSFRTIFYEREREKTPEELGVINIANEKTNELRRKFDLTDINIPQKNIYIIPNDAPWPKKMEDTFSYHIPMGQCIVIREPRSVLARNSRTVFAARVLHEMIHFKSYNSLKQTKNSSFDSYRGGLKTFKREESGESYFGNLSEAVVEELTLRIINELRKHPLFKRELDLTDKLKEKLSDIKTDGGESLICGEELHINFDEEDRKLCLEYKELVRERRILNKLIDKIFEKNTNKFKNKDEVFDLFVKAVMTGNIIPLEQLIDETFGKKTFERIAETGDNIDAEEKLINSLS